MHHETVGGTQSRTRRTEHVKVGWLFGVESVQGGGRTEAYRNGRAAAQVQAI